MTPPRLALTAFGLGLLKPAPGTWGSLPPVALALVMVSTTDPDSRWMIDTSLALLAVLAAITCVRFGPLAEAEWGRKDPAPVIVDEVAGQSLALLALPWGLPEDIGRNAIIAGIAFIAFRAFDIIKPPPVDSVQRLRGGWGILADDLLAGLYALATAQMATRIFWNYWP